MNFANQHVCKYNEAPDSQKAAAFTKWESAYKKLTARQLSLYEALDGKVLAEDE